MSRQILLLVLLMFACGAPAHAQAPLEDKFFDSNGVRIRYVEAGRGEPVVLINGLGDWVDGLWRNSGVIDALARDFHVIAFDNRGHGKSGKPRDVQSYGREMVDDVTRLLDRLQIRRAHVVGFSMGGAIAGAFSVVHPDRVLTATFGGSSPLVWTAETERDLTERAKLLDQGTVRNPDRNDPLAMAAVVRSLQKIAVTIEDIRALSMPLLAVVGSADVGKPRVDAFARLKPEVKLVVIEGAEHAGTTNRPEFAAAVREFLLAHRASTGSASVLAQSNPFVGTWELVARTSAQGVVDQNPSELMVFTEDGTYVRIELPKGRPRVDKPDAELTLEELRARYKGVIAFHGTYRVTGDRITAHVVAHTDPNREGNQAVRKITVDGDILSLSSATNPQFPALNRYRRIRNAGPAGGGN